MASKKRIPHIVWSCNFLMLFLSNTASISSFKSTTITYRAKFVLQISPLNNALAESLMPWFYHDA
jgi:hypothetical protein